jgi:rhodanese-related sulfurtransferase
MPNDPFVDIAALPSLGPVHYLDARDRVTFDAGHAPGAAHVSVEEWDKAAKVADIGFAKTAYWERLWRRSVSVLRRLRWPTMTAA